MNSVDVVPLHFPKEGLIRSPRVMFCYAAVSISGLCQVNAYFRQQTTMKNYCESFHIYFLYTHKICSKRFSVVFLLTLQIAHALSAVS